MSTKSREYLFGSCLRGAEMRAQATREEAIAAAREADHAAADAWSIRMEGFGGPAQPSPTLRQCLNGGLGWLEVVPSVSDARQHPAAGDPATEGHADLEARNLAALPVMRDNSASAP